MKELNCANCPHLEITPVANMCVVGCGKTGMMIPHRADNGEGSDPITIVCWRVPLSCPRPDSEVDKREERPDRNTWTTFQWTAESGRLAPVQER